MYEKRSSCGGTFCQFQLSHVAAQYQKEPSAATARLNRSPERSKYGVSGALPRSAARAC